MDTTVRNDQQMFDESISILITAFLKDELEHASCEACAVANLMLGRGCNFKSSVSATNWLVYIEEEVRNIKRWHDSEIYDPAEAIAQIQFSGYSPFEVHLIEQAFERVPYDYDLSAENPTAAQDKWMFDGLMAVVEVLSDIHKVDLSVKESAKLLFVKS